MPASPLPTCPSPDEVPLLPLLLSSSCRRRVFGDDQWQQCWRLPGWAALQVASLTAPVRHCLLTPPTLPASPSLLPSPVFALVPSLIFFLGHFATGAHSHDRQLGGGEFSTTLTQEPVPGTAKMAAVNNTRRLYVVPCSQVDFTVYFAFLCYLLCILFFFPHCLPSPVDTSCWLRPEFAALSTTTWLVYVGEPSIHTARVSLPCVCMVV